MGRPKPSPPRQIGGACPAPGEPSAPGRRSDDLAMLAKRGTITAVELGAVRYLQELADKSTEQRVSAVAQVRVDAIGAGNATETAQVHRLTAASEWRAFFSRCGRPNGRLLQALILRDTLAASWREVARTVTGEVGPTEQSVVVRRACQEAVEVFTELGLDLKKLIGVNKHVGSAE